MASQHSRARRVRQQKNRINRKARVRAYVKKIQSANAAPAGGTQA